MTLFPLPGGNVRRAGDAHVVRRGFGAFEQAPGVLIRVAGARSETVGGKGGGLMGCFFLLRKLGVWGLILLFAFVVLFSCPPGLYPG